MAGSIALQQGPFGVAASIRRPVPKPGATDAARVADTGSAALNQPPSRHAVPPRTRDQNSEQNQDPVGATGASTLFETSLIASAMMLESDDLSAPPAPRMSSWSPPSSSLKLRDRSI